jgi:hypothetical protein
MRKKQVVARVNGIRPAAEVFPYGFVKVVVHAHGPLPDSGPAVHKKMINKDAKIIMAAIMNASTRTTGLVFTPLKLPSLGFLPCYSKTYMVKVRVPKRLASSCVEK